MSSSGYKRKIDLTYCEFDLSKTENSRGGYFKEKESILSEAPLVPYAANEVQGSCEKCRVQFDLDENFWKYYKIVVCLSCIRSTPQSYALLTKTESKTDYLLTDGEMRDTVKLPCWIKKNPHKDSYANMLLYCRKQVEEFAWEKWGSPEGLDKEIDARKVVSTARKSKKFKKSMSELRKKTLTSSWESTAKDGLSRISKINGDHQHEYGATQDVEGINSMKFQACNICGMKLEFEEF